MRSRPRRFVVGVVVIGVLWAIGLPLAAWAAETGGATVTMQGQVSSLYLTEAAGGDRHRYQEDLQVRDGWTGGLDWLTTNILGQGWQLTSNARARHETDFQVNTRWERDGGLYLTQEGSLYPKYYDSSNRFYNSPPYLYDLDTTLRTLRGDFLVEGGVKASGQPHLFAGYRHQSRDGETNSYWGGWLRNADPDDFIMFVTPLQRERDEKTDTVYVGANHEWGGWSWGARQAYERFRGVDTYEEPGFYNDGQRIFTRSYRNQPRHDTWTTTLNGARQALQGRLRLTMDYHSTAVQTSSTTDVDSMTPAGARHYGEHSLNYLVAEHGGRSHSQGVGGHADYTPADWARVWAGVRFLAGRAVGVSTRGEEGAEAGAVDSDVTTVDEYGVNKSINREVSATEDLGLEITALPKTRIALDASLDQSRVKYDWSADIIGSRNSGNEGDWQWVSRYLEQRNRYTVSIRNWAIPWCSWWGRYRYRVDDADVDEQVDVANTKPGDPEFTHTTTAYYYPGRIEDTRRSTHETLVATQVRLTPRWSLRPQFEHRNSRYRVSGDAEPEISSYRSNTVSVGLMGQPVDHLTCSVNAARQFALTSTRANSFSNTINSPNATWFGGITPDFDASNTSYHGQVGYTARGITSTLTSGAVDGNGDFDTTLVYGGLGFRGPFGKSDAARWEVAYKYYDYHEDENNSINDYTAHAVSLTASKQF